MTNRISLWDNLKFILIITVVVGHFADEFVNSSDVCKSIYIFIYAFHMPLFLYISGMFHRNVNIGKKVLFYVSVGLLLKIFMYSSKSFVGKSPKFNLLSDKGLPWFMFVLAIFTVVTYLLRGRNKWYILAFSVILACFAGYDKSISDYLYLSRAIVFFPFYWLGTIITPDLWIKIKSKQKVLKITISLIIVAIWLYCSFEKLDFFYHFRHLFTGRNGFSAFVFDYGPLARLLCYGIACLVGASLIMLTPSKKIPIISNMGTRTIDVLVWHWPIYLVVDYYFNISSMFSDTTGKIAFLFTGVLLTLILSVGGPFEYPIKWIKKLCFSTPVKAVKSENKE